MDARCDMLRYIYFVVTKAVYSLLGEIGEVPYAVSRVVPCDDALANDADKIPHATNQ